MFKKPTAAEIARESKKEISQGTRALDRELASLQAEEKKLVAEIKRTAKAGNEASVRILAKNLVRVRAQVARLQSSKAQLRGIGTHVQTAQSSVVVASTVAKAGAVMKAANAQLDPIRASQIAGEFQKESAMMEHSEEVLGDALSGALDSEDVEEESDALTQEVLEALGVETRTQLASAPQTRLPGKQVVGDASEAFSSADEDDLERRMAALRN